MIIYLYKALPQQGVSYTYKKGVNMEERKFMDWESLAVFIVAVQQQRDALKKYFDTDLSKFHPNLYTKKYCDIISKLNSLSKALSAEVISQAIQLGSKERASIPRKFKQTTKKKRKRKKATK